jgi:hypothetical protein
MVTSNNPIKGPKLHDLTLSVGENKTFGLKKNITSLKLSKDIMLLKSISSFV